MVLGDFPVFVARGDLAGGGVDEHIKGFGKRGSALDVMVLDELKDFALRKHRALVIEGAIAKVKGKTGCDAISVSNLNKIADGEGAAFQRLKYQKSVERSLRTADRNWVSGKRFCC